MFLFFTKLHMFMRKSQIGHSLRCPIIFFVIVFLIFGISFADPIDKNKIIKTAQNGLIKFLTQIPESQKGQYGFPSNFQLAEVSLGPPLQLYEILPSKLTDYTKGMNVQALVAETDQWYFPVVLDNWIRCFLIVDWVDGSWEAVSLGHAILADAFSGIHKNYSQESGKAIRLIRSYQAGEYLFTIPGNGPFNLTTIDRKFIRGKAAHGKKPVKLGNIDDTVKRLKPIVERQLSISGQ